LLLIHAQSMKSTQISSLVEILLWSSLKDAVK